MVFFLINQIVKLHKNICIFAKDKNHKYTFANEALAEVAGLDSPAQMLGKKDENFVWRHQAELYTKHNTEALNGKVWINLQLPRTEKDKVATLLCTGMRVLDKDGYVVGFAGHSLDITGYHVEKNKGFIHPQKNTFSLGPEFGNDYLTRREFIIFKYLLLGKSTEEIAFKENSAIKTIQTHIKNIAQKLQCKYKSEIVPTALRHGLTHVLSDQEFKKWW